MPRRAKRRRRGDRSTWSNPLEFAARVPPHVNEPLDTARLLSCRNNNGAPEIPNHVFQAWLGGGKLMYAKLLSVLSVHFLLRPARHIILYDEEPNESPEWRCACRVAKCLPTALRTPIDASVDMTDRFASDKRGRCGSTLLDLLRIDTLLEDGGGAFFDLDVVVLQRMHAWRARCAGHAATFGLDGFGRLNPGVLLAPPRSPFLRRWRESFRGSEPAKRDFGHGCNTTTALAAAFNRDSPRGTAMVHAARALGPLPHYTSTRAYEAHLRHAPLVHLNAFRHEWRLRDVMGMRLLQRLWERVSEAIHNSTADDNPLAADPLIAGCLATIRSACWARPGGRCGIYGA